MNNKIGRFESGRGIAAKLSMRASEPRNLVPTQPRYCAGEEPTISNIGHNQATGLRLLSLRQETFLRCYIAHGNGARAAREAGYSAPHNVAAAKVLRSKKVRAEMRHTLESAGVTRNWLLYLLSQMLEHSLGDFIVEDEKTGSVKIDMQKGIASGAGCILKRVSIRKNGQVGLTMHDPVRIITRLAKLSGWI